MDHCITSIDCCSLGYCNSRLILFLSGVAFYHRFMSTALGFGVMAQRVKRLQKECQQLKESPPVGVTCWPEGDNLGLFKAGEC